MPDNKKMTKEEEEILAKDGEPTSDEELENVAGGIRTLVPHGKTTCKYCHEIVAVPALSCPYCYRALA